MPRVFGTPMDDEETEMSDTAFYGVDVDHQGTIIAVGVTYAGRLVTDSQGFAIA